MVYGVGEGRGLSESTIEKKIMESLKIATNN
jgi:hypothetical protein